MFRNKKTFLVTLFLIIAAIFTACENNTVYNSDTQQNNSAQIGDVKEYSMPQENKRGATETGISSATDSNGFYRISSGSVKYYDMETEKYITLCAQPGCAHNDETCQAWIGTVYSFVEYHGNIFAAVREEDGSFEFVRKDPASGKLDTLYAWKSDSGESYIVIINRATDNKILLYLRSYRLDEESGYEVDDQNANLLYDIETGEMQRIFENEDLTSIEILSIWENYALAIYTPQDQELLEFNEFEQQYGGNTSYGIYLSEQTKHELRLYDMNDYTYTVVADTEKDNYVFPPDSNNTCDYQVIYQCADDIYLFDVTSGKSEKIISMEGIINYWIMDHKVFLIINDDKDSTNDYSPDYDISIYYADLDERIPVRLNNAGNTEVMEFSIHREGNGFFIGMWKGGEYIISKTDFYAERYENACRI